MFSRPSVHVVLNKAPACKKTKWMPEEDKFLKQGITIHGLGQWTKIAAMVPGRSPKQCRERWTGQLDPSISRSEWTDQEDAFLWYLQATLGNAWAKIASFMPGRSANSVKNRHRFVYKNKPIVSYSNLLVKPRADVPVQESVVSDIVEECPFPFYIEPFETEEWI